MSGGRGLGRTCGPRAAFWKAATSVFRPLVVVLISRCQSSSCFRRDIWEMRARVRYPEADSELVGAALVLAQGSRGHWVSSRGWGGVPHMGRGPQSPRLVPSPGTRGSRPSHPGAQPPRAFFCNEAPPGPRPLARVRGHRKDSRQDRSRQPARPEQGQRWSCSRQGVQQSRGSCSWVLVSAAHGRPSWAGGQGWAWGESRALGGHPHSGPERPGQAPRKCRPLGSSPVRSRQPPRWQHR